MLILLPLFAAVLEIIYHINDSFHNHTQATTAMPLKTTTPIPAFRELLSTEKSVRIMLGNGHGGKAGQFVLVKTRKFSKNYNFSNKANESSTSKSFPTTIPNLYEPSSKTSIKSKNPSTTENAESHTESQLVANEIHSKESESKSSMQTYNPTITQLLKQTIYSEPFFHSNRKPKVEKAGKNESLIIEIETPDAATTTQVVKSQSVPLGQKIALVNQTATEDPSMRLKSLELEQSLNNKVTESTRQEDQLTKLKLLEPKQSESANEEDLTTLKPSQLSRSFNKATELTKPEDQLSKLKPLQLGQLSIKATGSTGSTEPENQLDKLRLLQLKRPEWTKHEDLTTLTPPQLRSFSKVIELMKHNDQLTKLRLLQIEQPNRLSKSATQKQPEEQLMKIQAAQLSQTQKENIKTKESSTNAVEDQIVKLKSLQLEGKRVSVTDKARTRKKQNNFESLSVENESGDESSERDGMSESNDYS